MTPKPQTKSRSRKKRAEDAIDYSDLTPVASLILEYVKACYQGALKDAIERLAAKLNVPFRKAVAMVIAAALAEEYIVVPRVLPGLPVAGKPKFNSVL